MTGARVRNRARRPQRAVLAAVAAGLLAAGGCAVSDDTEPGALVGTRLYVDPDSAPARQVALLRQAGQAESAERLRSRIAAQPVARWFTGEADDPFLRARALSTAAAARGEAPVITVYNLPERDCGLFSAGGAADDDAYLRYVGALAAGLGDRPAVVVLEPDAVPQSLVGCSRPVERTQRLLQQAVDVLGRQAGTRVYLDAGNASWIDDVPALARALQAGGVGSAAGFALNVSNFATTEQSADYGRRLSDQLDGAHFVIDTSRNGAGPPPTAGEGGGAHPWCNPPGRRLGTPPTTSPGIARVDALLWVKTPGDSDGACTPGAPAAGQWWPQLADDLMGPGELDG